MRSCFFTLRRVAMMLLALVVTMESRAATRTWTGAVSNAWATAGNWSGGVAIASGDLAIFPASGANKSTNQDSGTITLAGLTFTGSGYSIAGSQINLAGNITASNTSATNNISSTLSLSGANRVISQQTGGTLSLGVGGLHLAGFTATFSGGGAIDVTGPISDVGSIIKDGTGLLRLATTNTYIGGTSVIRGMLSLANSGALNGSTGTFVVTGGVVRLENNVTIDAEALWLNGTGPSGTGSLLASDNDTWSGPINISNGVRIHTITPSILTLGPISGTGGVRVSGPGTIVFSSQNTFAGPLVFDHTLPTTVRLNADNGIPPSAMVSLPGLSTLDLNGHATTIDHIIGSGTVTLGTGILKLAPTSFASFTGTMSGTGGVTMLGPFDQSLEGPGVNYTGLTDVQGGTINLKGAAPRDIAVSNAVLGVSDGAAVRNISISSGDLEVGISKITSGLASCMSLFLDDLSVYWEWLDDVTPGSSGRLSVTNQVTLGDARLLLAGTFLARPTNIWTIIKNDAFSAVMGTFASLPEGALTIQNGRSYMVSYIGGDGNDVTMMQMPARGDSTADLKTDIFWRDAASGANSIWLMNGTSVASSASMPTVADPDFKAAGIGDFQGDGKADIIWRNDATGANVVWLLNGPALAVSALLPAVADLNWKIIGVADFQRDGKADVLWRNSATGDNVIWFMEGTGVLTTGVAPQIPDLNWTVAAVGDVQGDSRADIVWRNTATGNNSLWIMDGATPIFTTTLPPVADTNWKIAGMGDLNADGKADIVWRNSVTGENSLWQMDGLNVTSMSALPAVPDPNFKIVRIADFQADARADIMWRNSVTGSNSVWLMNGSTLTTSASLPAVPDTNWAPAGTP